MPTTTDKLDLRLSVGARQATQPLRIYLDGAVVVVGAQGLAQPPSFDDPLARTGSWDGRAFANLIRNGSAEATWPRLRPWVDTLLVTYARRSPTLVLSALFDLERIAGPILGQVPIQMLQSFFGSLGWGHIKLPAPWTPVFAALALLALIGCIRWLAAAIVRPDSVTGAQRGFLACAAALVWGNVLLRGLPLLDGLVPLSVARYGFPAALPAVLALVGGWWALWPRRWRPLAVYALIAGLLVLNGAAIWTIRSFYQSLAF